MCATNPVDAETEAPGGIRVSTASTAARRSSPEKSDASAWMPPGSGEPRMNPPASVSSTATASVDSRTACHRRTRRQPSSAQASSRGNTSSPDCNQGAAEKCEGVTSPLDAPHDPGDPCCNKQSVLFDESESRGGEEEAPAVSSRGAVERSERQRRGEHLRVVVERRAADDERVDDAGEGSDRCR